MRKVRLLGVMALTLFLAACTSFMPGRADRNYLKQGQSVPPIKVPPSASRPKIESYYSVPSTALGSREGQVSLVPPGSDLYRIELQKQHRTASLPAPQVKMKLKHQIVPTVKPSTFANWNDQSTNLMLGMSSKKAWSKVGRALRATPYQILDQDDEMGAYYVLDTKVTNNKVTRNTPIYRMLIKKKGGNTQVVLLNKSNRPAASEVAHRILGAIHNKLN